MVGCEDIGIKIVLLCFNRIVTGNFKINFSLRKTDWQRLKDKIFFCVAVSPLFCIQKRKKAVASKVKYINMSTKELQPFICDGL